jgi:16S rRNA (cytosine967-C5)-methyltransferase
VLVAVEHGAFADAELGRRAPAAALASRDRALATRLVYGTLAWQGYLDYLLAALGRPAAALDVPIRCLVRLALFQVTRLARVPDFAAVDTAVELAKRHRRGAARGLVNALLRRFLREHETIALPPRDDLAGHLSVAHSHPPWLVARWLDEFGAAETEALLAANNEPAPTVLRVNRLRGTRDEALGRLAAAGVPARAAPRAPDAVVLEGGADPAALPGHADGLITPQGEASQLVVWLLGVAPGARVLDACAAPGGKATYIAERLRETGAVCAVDVNPRGVGAIRRTARRLGLTAIEAVCGDAAEVASRSPGAYDAVLLDAPCSGLGTLRQHPEIRWRRTPESVAAAAATQTRLLAAVAGAVRPGGILVYATCTLLRAENEEIVDGFLARRDDFTLVDAAPLLPPSARDCVDARGRLRTAPHRGGLDGFFAARLLRRGEFRMVRA